MMSFRNAVDDTLIAQLVGRMVRTPLARSVSASEFLNSVCLYLPYYDEEALDSVIENLTDPDPDVGFPTRVQRGEKLVTLNRSTAAAAGVRRRRAARHLQGREGLQAEQHPPRCCVSARLLAWDKLEPDAAKHVRQTSSSRSSTRAEEGRGLRGVRQAPCTTPPHRRAGRHRRLRRAPRRPR